MKPLFLAPAPTLDLPRARRQSGMTLVELMVGVTIALIALLIVATVVTTSGQQNKTTVSGSDAQTTGAMAAFTLERDLRIAGNGALFPAGTPPASDVICEVQAYDAGAPTAVPARPAETFGFSMAPVIINAQPAGTPDTITVFYGNPSGGSGFSTATLGAYDPAAPTFFPLNSGLGFAPGNLFLVARVSATVSQTGDARPDCFLGENISAVNASPLAASDTGTYRVLRGAANVPPDASAPFSTQYNRPMVANYTWPDTGTAINFTAGATGGDIVFNLGNRPSRDANYGLTCDIGDCAVNRTYGINNNQLTMTENLLAPGMRTAWQIADSVVMLKAEYGKDTNADGVVDTWDTSLNGAGAFPLWSQWNNVRAIRFAVVTRSKTRDPDIVTPPNLTLFPAISAPPALVAIPAQTWALTTEQRHFRYRVHQTMVPVRNSLWRQ